MKIVDLLEQKEAPVIKKYPDTKSGVIAFLQDPKEIKPSVVKAMDLATCEFKADPQVAGVWAVDSLKKGTRSIVYLAGYREPRGAIRQFSDLESGEFTFATIKSLVSRNKVNRKQIIKWSPEESIMQELDDEFEDDDFYNGR